MINDYNDTIVGIATAPGEAGISIIRISGENAVEIASKVFRPKGSCAVMDLKADIFLMVGWKRRGSTWMKHCFASCENRTVLPLRMWRRSIVMVAVLLPSLYSAL